MKNAPWDPDDRSQWPLWHPGGVLTILRGMPFERTDLHFARGSKSGVNYPVHSIQFACGCVAATDSGWTPCESGLHPVLAAESGGSLLIREFKELRAVFDAILAEAWRRRGRQPENYYEFHQALANEPFLQFRDWHKRHDLLGESVWQSGLLVASLEHIPGAEEIALYNGGHSDNIDLTLELRSDRGDQVLTADTVSALRTVFGYDERTR